MKYLITNTIQYTEYVYIEAEDEQSARDEAMSSDVWEKNFDEEIYETEIDEVSGEEWEEMQ